MLNIVILQLQLTDKGEDGQTEYTEIFLST